MATSINKQAAAHAAALPIVAAIKNIPMGLLGAALLTGTAGGAALAGLIGAGKNKPAKLRVAEEERKFYDARVKELANENWLNDVMTLRKKLDSKNLSNEERKATEKAYLDLIESNISE